MRAADRENAEADPLTWQQAMAHAHAAAAQIVASLPADVIRSIEHHEGELCRSDDGAYSWRTFTTVTLTPGTDAEPLVKAREKAFRERGDVDVIARRDDAGAWEVRVRSTTDTSGWIVGEGEPGTIWIDSWSADLALPDGIRSACEV